MSGTEVEERMECIEEGGWVGECVYEGGEYGEFAEEGGKE